MRTYAFGFTLELIETEIFFRFPKFPEIRDAISLERLQTMTDEEIEAYATDAVLAALQGHILARTEVPKADDITNKAFNGFARVPVQQAMKLEVAALYLECRSLADFARRIGKRETAARRIIDLNHNSRFDELESALAAFGKRIVASWEVRGLSSQVSREPKIAGSL